MPNTAGKMILLGGGEPASDCVCVWSMVSNLVDVHGYPEDEVL